ncbi:MAG: N-acetylmuramoyl-L-alanine amidase, partial [Verrucomicrobiae bacterium]|nr:N-acetylmuramoyl-L-alanine amidase [Verrucomicrobiae bacterium]
SVLVEAAFISNAEEERLLTQEAYQQLLAQAILSGIRDYLARYPPQRLLPVSDLPKMERPTEAQPLRSAERSRAGRREYVLNQGDTL